MKVENSTTDRITLWIGGVQWVIKDSIKEEGKEYFLEKKKIIRKCKVIIEKTRNHFQTGKRVQTCVF